MQHVKLQTRHEASGGKKGVRPCTCLCIDSIFTWIVIRPCDLPLLLKSLPINVINCIKFCVNCSALTGTYDWQ
jgi:hypothetical protein